MKYKLVYISGSRADYYVMKRSLMELRKEVDLTIIATSMHLSPSLGYTVREMEKDGFNVRKVHMLLDSDSLSAMAKSFGIGTYGISQVVEEIDPDLIFVEGDRAESLAGAIVGAHLNIPVIHHGGGDLSSSIDNKIRYAITMFSGYHLTGNKESRRRLIKIGISKSKVFDVGEPGLDDIYAGDFTSKESIIKQYETDQDKPLILLAQYPNTEEFENVDKQIIEILEAIRELGIQTIALYSNLDAGGRRINQILEKYVREIMFLKISKNIRRRDFLGLMNTCSVIVGNTSAGIVESPSFGKAYVCVGTRQRNRLRAGNTIDVGYNRNEIIDGVRKALYDKEFREKLKDIKNPYGDGKASKRIVEIILKILNGKL